MASMKANGTLPKPTNSLFHVFVTQANCSCTLKMHFYLEDGCFHKSSIKNGFHGVYLTGFESKFTQCVQGGCGMGFFCCGCASLWISVKSSSGNLLYALWWHSTFQAERLVSSINFATLTAFLTLALTWYIIAFVGISWSMLHLYFVKVSHEICTHLVLSFLWRGMVRRWRVLTIRIQAYAHPQYSEAPKTSLIQHPLTKPVR